MTDHKVLSEKVLGKVVKWLIHRTQLVGRRNPRNASGFMHILYLTELTRCRENKPN